MKKLFLLLVVVAGAFVFSSCQKQYVCTQTKSINGTLDWTDVTTYDGLNSRQLSDIENTNTYSYVTTGGDQIVYKMECK